MSDSPTQFHIADYVVFFGCLLLSSIIGIVYGFMSIRKKKSAKEQMTGGKSMGIVPVSLSILASFQAAPFILGTPAEMYMFGTIYCFLLLGVAIAVPITAHIFIPILCNLDLINGYQYFEMRFNRATKLCGSATFCLMIILYQAVVVYAPALAFSQVTGMSQVASILGVGLIATFYTAIGGLAAVIWIDVLQMIIILAGLIVMAILAAVEVGGWNNVIDASNEGGRIIFDNFDPDPTVRQTFWSQTIGGIFVALAVLASNQATIQKYLSIGKVRDAQKTPYIVWLAYGIYLFLVCFLGLTMYTYYQGCDPLITGKVEKNDQLILLLMMDVMGHLHGIPGLFTSAVFCASLSTVSAGINALAAVTMVDFVMPVYMHVKGHGLSEKLLLILSKSLTVFYGLLTIGFAYLAPLLGDTLLQIAFSIFGTLGGPLLGLMLLGFFVPFANAAGAISGLAASVVIGLWICIGAIATDSMKGQAFKSMLPLRIDECPTDMVTAASFNGTSMTYDDVTGNLTNGLFSTAPPAGGPPAGPPGSEDALWIYRVSYMWYAMIAVVVLFLVAIPVSLLTGGRRQAVDRKLMVTCACCKRDDNGFDLEKVEEPSDGDGDVIESGDKQEQLNGHVNQAFTPDKFTRL